MAFTDVEQSHFDVLHFYVFGIDIITLKKTVKGIIFHRFISYKGPY